MQGSEQSAVKCGDVAQWLTISVPSRLSHQVLGWSRTREVQASPRRRGVELFLWIQSLPIDKKSVSAHNTGASLSCKASAHQCTERNLLAISLHSPCEGPVFVVQWLFDEAQLTVDNIQLTGQPVQEGQWRYIQNLGIELRNTLKDVP